MNAEPTAPMGGVSADAQQMPPMEDPNMPMDPNMGGEMPTDNGPEMGGEPADDSTMGIINQLSPKDKEAVRAYAESMLARDEAQQEDGDEVPPMEGKPPMEPQQPMAESVVFKKSQLDKVNEIFGNNEKERVPLMKKEKDKISNKSPFNAPEFN